MNRDLRFKSAALPVLPQVVNRPVEPPTIGQAASTKASLSLGQALEQIGPLPEEALFLGLAEDGLPVLLNLWDSSPGPVLVAGDSYAGKTRFLQSLSRFTVAAHSPSEIQYGVITAQPDQWEADARHPNCIGIFPTAEKSAADFIQALVLWINLKCSNRQSILLLIDGLDDFLFAHVGFSQGLRQILREGPARQIWPFITVDLECFLCGDSWLQYFHTRVFGYTEHIDALQEDCSDAEFERLARGTEFCTRASSQWLKFQVPA